jgi:NTE family protein
LKGARRVREAARENGTVTTTVTASRADCHRPPTQEVVAFIDAHRDEFVVEPICTILRSAGVHVAPSTYYANKVRPLCAQTCRDAVVGPALQTLWEDNYRVYGARKPWKAARRAGNDLGRDQVARHMRAAGIAGVRRGKRVLLALWRPEQAATQGDYENLDFGMDEDFGNGAAEELDGCRRRGRSCAAHTVPTRPAKPGDAGNTQQNHRGGRLCSGYSYAMTCNAFVLGGGGVLGAAEVGMARALLEAGVRPDLVCGTSIGAINGAALAADPTPGGVERLLAIWGTLADDGVLDGSLIRRVAEVMRGRTSLHGNDILRQLLRDRLPAHRFEDLAVPFECVAASIERAQEHWFNTGDLIEPILASCALPGVFPAVRIGDEHFYDGGLVNSIPLERAVARGADTVWVLHVGRLEEELAAPRYLWQVAFVAFEISRRHRFHNDLERVGSEVTVHVLPTGMPQRPAATWSNLRYRDTGRIARRAQLAYDATREYLEALP